MIITGIELNNVKSFKKLEETILSKRINILVGPNNSGKSVIINSIFKLQNPNALNPQQILLGAKEGTISLNVEGLEGYSDSGERSFQINLTNGIISLVNPGGFRAGSVPTFPRQEPKNPIYPYLSKRKVVSFNNQVNGENAESVTGNFQNLISKIDRISNIDFQPASDQYRNACKNILGFVISTTTKGKGKDAILNIHNLENISLADMGEGVTNIVGLITDLCLAENKIFLIEELENDIHPKALKKLLELIVEKSEYNQFFISTHSNIVMKHLGAIPEAKVFRVANEVQDEDKPNLRYSTMTEIPNEPEARREILEELGYDFFDFGLWKAWLFLEESSAEIIIRDYLIKWFTPELLGRLRTFSANGIDKIKSKFDDFNQLFVFLNMQQTYKNRVWVYIDAGNKEEGIIEEFKDMYTKSGWEESCFNQFSEHDFEKYYPAIFQEKVDVILNIKQKRDKRQAKKDLLNEVKAWIQKNEDEAKAAFEQSASEIIQVLKSIAQNIQDF